jgi:uncharacterized membrane protein YkvA (DUF1232 family)
MSNQRKRSDPDLLAKFWHNMVLSWRLLFDRRVGGMTKLIPLVMLAYILSPLDLIPDLLLPFGVMDDLGALVLGLQLFIHSAPRAIVDEHRRRMRGEQPPQILDGHYEQIDDAYEYDYDYDDDDEYDYRAR